MCKAFQGVPQEPIGGASSVAEKLRILTSILNAPNGESPISCRKLPTAPRQMPAVQGRFTLPVRPSAHNKSTPPNCLYSQKSLSSRGKAGKGTESEDTV